MVRTMVRTDRLGTLPRGPRFLDTLPVTLVEIVTLIFFSFIMWSGVVKRIFERVIVIAERL